MNKLTLARQLREGQSDSSIRDGSNLAIEVGRGLLKRVRRYEEAIAGYGKRNEGAWNVRGPWDRRIRIINQC